MITVQVCHKNEPKIYNKIWLTQVLEVTLAKETPLTWDKKKKQYKRIIKFSSIFNALYLKHSNISLACIILSSSEIKFNWQLRSKYNLMVM